MVALFLWSRGGQPFQSMRQNFSPHKHSFEDAPHKHSFLFIAHKRVVVYLYFEVKTTPYSGVISKKKGKKKVIANIAATLNILAAMMQLTFFLEITSEMAKIMGVCPQTNLGGHQIFAQKVCHCNDISKKKKKVIACFAAPFPSPLA